MPKTNTVGGDDGLEIEVANEDIYRGWNHCRVGPVESIRATCNLENQQYGNIVLRTDEPITSTVTGVGLFE